MASPVFIDRKLSRVAEQFAAADPRDLGTMIAVIKSHQKRIAEETQRNAEALYDFVGGEVLEQNAAE